MLPLVAEMDTMIGTTLKFARDEAAMEARRATDLSAWCRASSTTWRTPECR